MTLIVKYRDVVYTVEKIIEPCDLIPYTLYKLKEKKGFKNVRADACEVLGWTKA